MKLFVVTAITLAIALSVYDYLTLRRTALNSGPSLPPSLSLELPSPVDRQLNLTWKIDSATPRSTDFTTVYWSQESSPSSLSTTDSPAAAGYPNHLTDYTDGNFFLPAIFPGRLNFSTPGVYYLRAYAYIDGQHYWTEQLPLEIK